VGILRPERLTRSPRLLRRPRPRAQDRQDRTPQAGQQARRHPARHPDPPNRLRRSHCMAALAGHETRRCL